MYEPPGSGGAQIHDFNPGITQNGLFWTTVLPENAVSVDLTAGTATMHVADIHQKDYFDITNALLGTGPNAAPGVVSFTVQWTATGEVQQFDNPSQQYSGSARSAIAQMEWTGRTPDYEFVSAPLATSTTDAAQLGQESNGSFY